MNPKIRLREMQAADAELLARAFAKQGRDRRKGRYADYASEQAEGKRLVLIAEHEGEFAGYLTIAWQSADAEFRAQGIPEITDFKVLLKYRYLGIGTALMNEAERRVAERSDVAGICVGLTADYGAAQVMYIKRGYVPDGRGISQREQVLRHGDQITIDDDLIWTLTKRLRK